MKALSVRAPWWWYILHAGKDIENREWSTRFRGTIYLHASKWWQREEIGWDADTANRIAGWQRDRERWPSETVLKAGSGCIVGTIDIVDCVDRSDSPWFFGRYGFVLANPVVFGKPVPQKGELGFFDVKL